jgi:hypothetical protein
VLPWQERPDPAALAGKLSLEVLFDN